jgi:hypothetical protein
MNFVTNEKAASYENYASKVQDEKGFFQSDHVQNVIYPDRSTNEKKN